MARVFRTVSYYAICLMHNAHPQIYRLLCNDGNTQLRAATRRQSNRDDCRIIVEVSPDVKLWSTKKHTNTRTIELSNNITAITRLYGTQEKWKELTQLTPLTM